MTATSLSAPLFRWYISSATFAVPQAAGPVAFALVALALTGDTGGAAAMILALTLAQVIGAIPITRLGRGLPPTTFLRLLVGFRTVALCAVAVLAHFAAPWCGWSHSRRWLARSPELPSGISEPC